MILTCPACDTKYVVKDGAIPPQGRQVRCANCKESWFQPGDGEAGTATPGMDHGLVDEHADTTAERAAYAPHEPQATWAGDQEAPADDPGSSTHGGDWSEKTAEHQGFGADAMTAQDAGIAAEPVPAEVDAAPVSEPSAEAIDGQYVAGPPVADADYEDIPDEPLAEPVEDFAVVIPDEDDDRAAGGRGKRILFIALLLIAVLAIAGWMLAPESLKGRLGLAGAGKTPLELMVTTSDRQQLASGNELLAISGRVINPTAEEQAVPAIRAELHNKASKKLVYSWTIAPPARTLPPGGSASFNSAEVDIPPGGDELTVTLAGSAG